MYETVKSVPIISPFLEKMKDVKKFGVEKNIGIPSIPILNSIMLIFLISAKITIGTFYLMDYLESTGTIIPNYIYEISAYTQLILWGVLTIAFLPLISKLMIRVESIGQRLLFAGISRMDLYLWKKYRKESLVSQFIWKLQYRMHSISNQNKRQILLIGLVAYSIYAIYRLGYL